MTKPYREQGVRDWYPPDPPDPVTVMWQIQRHRDERRHAMTVITSKRAERSNAEYLLSITMSIVAALLVSTTFALLRMMMR